MRGSVESYTGGAPRREPSCHISRGFLSYLGERLSGYRHAAQTTASPRSTCWIRIRLLARRAGVASVGKKYFCGLNSDYVG